MGSTDGNAQTTEDGTKYIVVSDGYGHPTVGYGIDIYNSGFLDRFVVAGYDVSIGAQIDVDFVDALEDEEIQNALRLVEENCSGLNLKQYQKYALVSRIYNCGPTGSGVLGGRFENAYNQYWNQETDDEYKIPMNEGMYNNRLYTNYMSLPNTSEGVYSLGLERRRKSEWILFKTGYYDNIDKWASESEGGDILTVCKEVTDDMLSRNVHYSLTNLTHGNIESASTHPYACCATYVSVVLYKSGLLTEEQINAYNYNYTGNGGIPDMLKAAGWTQVSHDEIQPGDVINDVGVHVLIYAGDGKVWDQNCGVINAGGSPPTGEPYNGWETQYKGRSNVQVWRAP